ncbi:MAG: carboxylate--amine ligase [Chloroflexi bacterium]|nr:MAG: carboxylate--amine ligase [Chloroflexota bacterium]
MGRFTSGEKPHAIVIGLDCMTGLQTARILARHGVPQVAIVKNPHHYCARTRLVRDIFTADTSSEAFINLLEKLGPEFDQKPVLIPCLDMAVYQMSVHRDRLEPYYRFALPDHNVVERLMNKTCFYLYAQEQGFPIPPTFFLKSREDAECAAAKLSFPAILKPPIKTPTWEHNTKAKVFKVESAEELLKTYDRCAGWADLVMAQEWIVGTDADLYSCNCYFNAESEPLVTFVARKLRQWPPETGTSCLGEEVRNDEVLNETIRLFRAVDYYGLGYVEMKQDQRTGKHYIVEPNIGRPTGRSAIAEAGGVELIYTAYCDLTGLPLPENRTQMYRGAKWISFRRDVQSAWYYWRRGDLTLRDWIRSWRGKKVDAIFSRRDPAPFIYDVLKPVAEFKDKLLRRN